MALVSHWRIPEWFSAIDAERLNLLRRYYDELLRFNGRVNLISHSTIETCDEVHFADCLYASECLSREQIHSDIYDIGSGNGFPGLVLAIMGVGKRVILIESDSRKCEFLKHVVHVLGIDNCVVSNVRLGDLGNIKMECAISRGFASISKSILVVSKYMHKGSKYYHMKSSNWSAEIARLPVQTMPKWKPTMTCEYSLPDSHAERAVICTTKLVD